MYLSTGSWYTEILPKEQGGYGEIYRRVFKVLGLSIFVPLVSILIMALCTHALKIHQVAGQILQNLFPSPVKKTIDRFKLNKLGSVALLIIIWSTYDQAFSSHALDSVKASNMVFIVFISIAFFLLFLAICFVTSNLWLPREDTISVCYCVPAKTPAMGVPLANVMFLGLSPQLESKIQIPMVIYQGLQIFAGSLLTLVFRRWIEPEKQRTAASQPTEEHTDTR
jgi:sodium/bile acid cotransporter 7